MESSNNIAYMIVFLSAYICIVYPSMQLIGMFLIRSGTPSTVQAQWPQTTQHAYVCMSQQTCKMLHDILIQTCSICGICLSAASGIADKVVNNKGPYIGCGSGLLRCYVVS